MANTFLAICLVDDLGNIIDEVPIHVCTSRTPTYSAAVTKFPVESGSSITDHRRKEPDGYEIEGMVSATPIVATDSTSGELRGDAGMAAPPSAPAPTQAAHDALYDLHANGRLVTIIDEYRQYENMALTRLSMPRNAKTGQALDFQATFEQVVVVKTSAAALPANIFKKIKKRQKISEDEQRQRLRSQAAENIRTGKVQAQDAKPALSTKSTAIAAGTPRP